MFVTTQFIVFLRVKCFSVYNKEAVKFIKRGGQ